MSGSTWEGVDVDLANAMGDVLGVKFNFSNVAFPGELPGLEGGRFDLIIDEIGDTVPREAIADFVDYSTDSTAIVVKKGNPDGIDGMSSLCGKSVAITPGSTPQLMVANYQAKCTSAGKAQISAVSVPAPADTYLAVTSGRATATLNGYSTMAYSIAQGGVANGLEIAPGPLFAAGINGIAVAKTNPQLRDAIQAALNAIIADGRYGTIMSKWGVSALGVKSATVNDAKAFPANLGG
jgi:polar amino acid transport system substrate-binding protein